MTPSEIRAEYGRHEGDEIALAFFTPDDLALSPEEYAARRAHDWGCFALHLYSFRDPVLGAWVKRFGELFSIDGEIERLRQQYLTPVELAAVRAREQEPW